jgi:arylsulfatase A
VPAMIRFPARIPAGQTRDQIVTIMDWFPTVLDFCGIKPEAGAPKLDGRSLAGLIADPKAASAHEIMHFAWAKNWAVRRGDWKLIATFDPQTNATRHSLHRLAEPSPEVKDHSLEQPEIVRELNALHAVWEKSVQGR